MIILPKIESHDIMGYINCGLLDVIALGQDEENMKQE